MLDFKRIKQDFPELYVDEKYKTIQLCSDLTNLLRIFHIGGGSYRAQAIIYPLSDFGVNMSSQRVYEDDMYDFIKNCYADLVNVKNFFENQYDIHDVSQRVSSYGFYPEKDYFWDVRFDMELDEDSNMSLFIPQLTDTSYLLDYHLVIPQADIFIQGDSLEDIFGKLGEKANG